MPTSISENKPPKQIEACRSIVAKSLGLTKVFVRGRPLVSSQFQYYFYTPDSSQAETGNRLYSVIPFFSKGSVHYWLGASVDIEQRQSVLLKDVSLVLFEGERSDTAKIAAFRAEWHHFDDQRHAQPHWHVYSVIEKSVEDIPSPFGSEPEIKDFNKKGLDANKHFHFAMGSQWQVAKESHSSQIDLDSVCKWMDGCVRYVRGQFDFLYSG